MKLDGKWIITFDEEKWDANNFGEFDSKEEAIAFINETGTIQLFDIWLDETGDEPDPEQTGVTIYIGQMQGFVPSVNVDTVLDEIAENASWVGGDYADDYLHHVPKDAQEELEEKLNSVLSEWIENHQFHPTFYTIENIETIEKSFETVV